LVSKPDDLSFEQAASVPIAGVTALQGLRDKGHLRAGQKVLIIGAAGGVGTFAVQIAKFLGADVTGVCSTRNVEMVRSLGADRVIDYTQQDFTHSAQHYDLVLDNVGTHSLSGFRRAMTPRGRCVMVGAPKQMLALVLRVLKALAWSRFLRQKFTFFIARLRNDDLGTLCQLMKSKQVIPAIDRRYALGDAAEAIAYVQQGHARAKVVICPQ
jgi:NADPH:quinone reductase-like Zn-dependent oxidoreductase